MKVPITVGEGRRLLLQIFKNWPKSYKPLADGQHQMGRTNIRQRQVVPGDRLSAGEERSQEAGWPGLGKAGAAPPTPPAHPSEPLSLPGAGGS